MRFPASPRRALRAAAAAASFGAMTRLPLHRPALLLPTLALALAGCSQPAPPADNAKLASGERSEEHTSELQSLMRISYAVFCLKKKNKTYTREQKHTNNRSTYTL